MNDLFDYHPEAKDKTYPNMPARFSNDSTSKAAAEAIKPDMGRLQKRIFERLERSPATAREVENELDLRSQTVTARIRELVLGGKVKDSGERRPTDSGRKAIVWQTI